MIISEVFKSMIIPIEYTLGALSGKDYLMMMIVRQHECITKGHQKTVSNDGDKLLVCGYCFKPLSVFSFAAAAVSCAMLVMWIDTARSLDCVPFAPGGSGDDVGFENKRIGLRLITKATHA